MVFLLTALLLGSSFPHVDVPGHLPAYGAVAGDSVIELEIPQQLIPGFCRSLQAPGAGIDDGLFVSVPDDTGKMLCLYRAEPDSAWQQLTAVGYCDTIERSYSFPALLEVFEDQTSLAMIGSKTSGSSPFAFFQPLDPSSTDTCGSNGIAVTDANLPDTVAAIHHPTLVIPATEIASGGRVALSVWDTYSWESYLFTSEDGGQSFSPDSISWSSAIPRPDTCSGGPTLIAISPAGDLLACILADTFDSTHIGLQPYVTWSHDFGETWDNPVMLPSVAVGSALGGEPGPMPYGSFRGGCPWYGAEIRFQGETPLIIWRARRAPGDTVTAEERLWPGAQAILCSHYVMAQWETVYIGRALEDSLASYGWPDWPTSTLSENGALIAFWSDATADSAELDIWGARRDPVSGYWSEPAALTSTSGSEAMLEALPNSDGYECPILLSDARLLIGEKSALRLAMVDLLPAMTSEIRTDVVPSLSGDMPLPEYYHADVRIVPNPVASSFRLLVSPEVELTDINLFDLLGRRVNTDKNRSADDYVWSVRDLAAGTYVLRWRRGAEKGSVPVMVVRP